jgi:hypothetical protein
MSKYFLIFFLVYSLVSCFRKEYPECPVRTRGGYDNRLHIVNNSTDTLTIGFQFEYPDTTLDSFMGPPYYNIPDNVVEPGENQAWNVRQCWESIFSQTTSGIAQVFLFDVNILRTTDWSKIKEEKRYLKRYQFNLEEIKAQNWEIVYEP